ncbi:MAG: response regulator, partial [Gammaproteobacteria bacterium]|nr:response regulator [Gammaproteobacteria bacterium]
LMKATGYHSRACATAYEFLDCYDSSRPACLLLDVRLAEMNGLELQQRLVDEAINIPIIIMSGHADVPIAVKAMKLGALDFIEKPFSTPDLLECVATGIAQGTERWNKNLQADSGKGLLATLSIREHEVAQKLVDGKLNKQIAADLGISVRTVEGHRARILKKLQITSLSELTRLFLL